MTRSKRAAIYTRVSTDGQSVQNQLEELRTIAAKHGWEIAAEFSDAGISGAKGRDKRPAFDKLLKAATRRDIDMVVAWSVDRLGRSLQDLVGFLGEIHGAGVDLYLHLQGLDTSTPSGRAMFQMLGVFAEFERSMIVARVHAGITQRSDPVDLQGVRVLRTRRTPRRPRRRDRTVTPRSAHPAAGAKRKPPAPFSPAARLDSST